MTAMKASTQYQTLNSVFFSISSLLVPLCDNRRCASDGSAWRSLQHLPRNSFFLNFTRHSNLYPASQGVGNTPVPARKIFRQNFFFDPLEVADAPYFIGVETPKRGFETSERFGWNSGPSIVRLTGNARIRTHISSAIAARSDACPSVTGVSRGAGENRPRDDAT